MMQSLIWYAVQFAIVGAVVYWFTAEADPPVQTNAALLVAVFVAAFCTLAITRIIELFTIGGRLRWLSAALFAATFLTAIFLSLYPLSPTAMPSRPLEAIFVGFVACALMSGAYIAVYFTILGMVSWSRRRANRQQPSSNGTRSAAPRVHTSDGAQQIDRPRISRDPRKLL